MTYSELPPIAIVGMGLRLPGGVASAEDYWKLIVDKKDARSRVPKDRYNVDAFHDGTQSQHTVASDHGYFLDVDVASLDAAFFSMSRSEVEQLDPQQRLLLQVVWECMENAGQTQWRGSKTACYVGSFGEDFHVLKSMDHQSPSIFGVGGSADFSLSNRVSYEYDLKGPSMTIRTACSSSLICLNEACKGLIHGECSGAIVCGSSLFMNPQMTIAMSRQGVLSPTGSCNTFDASANGFARGEAVNAVYIKLLQHAIRDGDPIRAVIRSTTTNCDGKTPGFGVPSTQAHEDMMRRAYAIAGIEHLSQTPFIECHGTGTQVGDPLEARAVANVFGGHPRGTYIGSVKPNVGHSEGASGITSLIKAVLALENNTIPPNIKFSNPNPRIPFEEANLVVPVDAVPWPKDRAARISINSFGIGGANAHVVVESAASWGFPTRSPAEHCPPETAWPYLIVLSANTSAALRLRVQHLNDYVTSRPGCLKAVAHTLGRRRDHMAHRAFCLAKDGAKCLDFEPVSRAMTTVPEVVFVFTGQGAHWHGMAKDLIMTSSSFRDDICTMDQALQELAHPPQWTIQEIVCSRDYGDLIHQPQFSQPLCTAIQIALVNFLARCNISPWAVVGHSSGEIAAAYAAGAVSTTEAIVNAYHRGLAAFELAQTSKGGMAAIGLGKEAVSPLVAQDVVVACENSPDSVTISGEQSALEATMEAIKSRYPNALIKRLPVSVAYHSGHMDQVEEAYQEMMKQCQQGQASYGNGEAQPQAQAPTQQALFFSSVTGQLVDAHAQLGPSYWGDNLRSPVLFHSAVKSLLDQAPQNTIFVEVGPHSALKGPLRQIATRHTSGARPYVPTLLRHNDSAKTTLEAVGQLHLLGLEVDFSVINPTAQILTDLPSYPFNNERYWRESRVSLEWRQRKHIHHELLGSRLLEASDEAPLWRNLVSWASIPWLEHHKIHKDIVFPCVGFIAAMGEAIRQVTGSRIYTLRNLTIKSAMVVQESETREMMTSMRPLRLTDTDNSRSWFEISISSHSGSAWVEHCVAQAMAGELGGEPLEKTIPPLPRQVSHGSWYKQFEKIGLNYGSTFRGMKDISADPHEAKARAVVGHELSQPLTKYSIHPATMDHVLQLGLVAWSRGMARQLTHTPLPSTIRHICVKPARGQLVSEATLSTAQDVNTCHGVAVDKNQIVIKFVDVSWTLLALDSPRLPPACRLKWRPDFNSIDGASLMSSAKPKRSLKLLLEAVYAICLLHSLDNLASVTIPQTHLAKLFDWLQEQKYAMSRGQYVDLVPDAQHWALADAATRSSVRSSLGKEIESNSDGDFAMMGKLVLSLSEADNIRAVFTETKNPVEIMVKDDGLTSVYNFFGDMIDFSPWLSLYAHAKPALRVLEIGGGTGGTTEKILEALTTKQGVRFYSQYVFTDISSGFFPAAKSRFESYSGLDYKVLDITHSPQEQGFELGSFDLIVASNVLHATPNMQQTLHNVRSLLGPGGRLFLHELLKPMPWGCISFIMGFLPGWWLGEQDGRAKGPILTSERWDKELRLAGFSGIDSMVKDDDELQYVNAILVSTAVDQSPPPPPAGKAVTFLCNKTTNDFAVDVARRLEQRGYKVSWSAMGHDTKTTGNPVLSFVDLEDAYFHDISKTDYEAFMSYLSKLQSSMLWLMRPAQIACTDARYGTTVGLARTIRLELPVDFVTVELDKLDSTNADGVVTILETRVQQQTKSSASGLSADDEYALHKGTVYTGRYHWFELSRELEGPLKPGKAKRLVIEKSGFLDKLRWVQDDTLDSSRLGDSQVELEVRCAGVNFRDLLITMGIVPSTQNCTGFEVSGVVLQTGPSVTHVKVGDGVIAMTEGGGFATRVRVEGVATLGLPDSLSFDEAASMPVVFTTVVYSVVNLARLSAGQSVLIHSACGGVGLAAIQICKMLGAEIYATVGNEEKTQYLVDQEHIACDRIFNSRNASFVTGILEATGGRGVDVVLNSLSGDLLHASWQCVAVGGKMIELGKRDLIGRGSLALEPFLANRAYFGFDLVALQQQCPAEFQKAMKQALEYYCNGQVKPIRRHVLGAGHVADAFRQMQGGQHMGKFVIDMQDADAIPAVDVASQQVRLSGQATYLLAGGLGGLGKAITRWMVERGAASFVFLSPSAHDASHTAFLHELEAQGCHAVVVAGSVSQRADVERAVQAAPRPIAGVLQLSMVLRDGVMGQMTHHDWAVVQAPKVQGTWNLHEALGASKLDFFLLFGSMSAEGGNMGQASYTSANAFLNSFVQYRHSLGLPCSIVGLGVVEAVGYVSRNATVAALMRDRGYFMLQEQHVIDAIQIAMNESLPSSWLPTSWLPTSGHGHDGHDGHDDAASYTSRGHIIVGMNPPSSENDSNRNYRKQDIRMGHYRVLSSPGESKTVFHQDNVLGHFVASVQTNAQLLYHADSLQLVTTEIGRSLCRIMVYPEENLDYKANIKSLGIDSLVAIEIRNWWHHVLGLDISVLEIMSADSVEALGNKAIASLQTKFGGQDSTEMCNGNKNHGNGALEPLEKIQDYLATKAP